MNPFELKAKKVEDYIESIKGIYPKPYDKNETSPYTKARIILATGAEYEANWFSHQFNRKVGNNDLRRELGLARFVEKEQQQKLSNLKPLDESVLETTIAYEQLAVDLTAEMAQKEQNFNVKKALDFALLEDFDHLYRYSDLLDMDYGVHAERLVGGYTEIMPARPTVAHQRHPYDNVKKPIVAKESNNQTILNTMIITAAEQQTMNYYMNQSAFYFNDLGRRLYEEICLVEEQHVTQYGSLIDTNSTLLECLLWHEYSECFLYWSNMETETDKHIRPIWEQYFEAEVSHLHKAVELLKKYEKKDYTEVIKNPEFPTPLSLHENVEYVRSVLNNSVCFTGDKEDYKCVCKLNSGDRFLDYNSKMIVKPQDDASSEVIKKRIKKCGEDYRYQIKEHPIKSMQNRKKDNITMGVSETLENPVGFIPLK